MDVPAGSFSYTLTAPSSYLGLSFASFNGTGSYDAPGEIWNFSGAGDLDHRTISGSGSSVVIPSGQEPDAGMSDWDYNWNGHTFHFHADCNYFDPFPAIPNLFSLRSTCTFTDKDTGAKYMATDVYDETNGAWMFTLMAPAFNVMPLASLTTQCGERVSSMDGHGGTGTRPLRHACPCHNGAYFLPPVLPARARGRAVSQALSDSGRLRRRMAEMLWPRA